MNEKLRAQLIRDEGKVAHAYQDSEGYWTIGVGHLIDPKKGGSLPPHIAAELKRRGIDIWADEPMPDDLIDALFDWDLEEHEKLLFKYQPWVRNLDPVRRAVMIDMTFNLGPEPFDNDGFKDWPMFLRQVREGRYAEAAANMRSTLWAKQVKSRAVRLAKMMETGQWPQN